MTKAKKSAKAAKQFGESLTLTITIPAPAVPLFKAMAALKLAVPRYKWEKLHQQKKAVLHPMTIEDVAAHAVIRWISSEEAMDCIDSAVNTLLASQD